jgi:hypothetical protein
MQASRKEYGDAHEPAIKYFDKGKFDCSFIWNIINLTADHS